MQLSERWHRSKKHWNILTYYQRFESAIAFVLTGGAQVHHSRHTRRDHRLSARTGGNYPGTRGNLSAHARA
jgi:hypothetical protein